MDKYLFLFYDGPVLMGWECFDPKEPISDAMAVHQAFNMLILDDTYTHAMIYSYGSDDDRLLICTISK